MEKLEQLKPNRIYLIFRDSSRDYLRITILENSEFLLKIYTSFR